MGNRIQDDPSADPEQDFFGFVSEGIDHAGLLALLAPRPTLLGTARLDFFPIEGARESFAEAKRLFEIAGVGDRDRARRGRRATRADPAASKGRLRLVRALAGNRHVTDPVEEIPVTPRPAKDCSFAPSGQVNQTFRSRPFLPLALEEFDRRGKPPRVPLQGLARA